MGTRVTQILAEFLLQDPFPGIKLEQGMDNPVFQVAEASGRINANILHGETVRLQAGFLCALGQIGNRFPVVFDIA